MYYFRRNGDMIEKYKISFDREKMITLSEEIVYKCSEIVHKQYVSVTKTDLKNKRFKNFDCKKIINKTSKEDRISYEYSYDEYEPPYLYEIVKKLLAGDEETLFYTLLDLFDESMEKERISIDEKLNVITKLYIKTQSPKIKKHYLEKLIELNELRNKNLHLVPVDEYYDKVRDLLEINLVDTIDINDIGRMESFLGNKKDTHYYKMNFYELKKTLKKK